MQAYRAETTITPDKALTLHSLPFEAGEQVEVIILSKTTPKNGSQRYPLRGLPIKYVDPFEPVAEHDWDTAR